MVKTTMQTDARPTDAAFPGALDPLIRRLPPDVAAHQNNRAALDILARHIGAFRRGHIFKRFQQADPDAVVLLDGMAARVRTTQDGRRSIVGFLLPGEVSVARAASNYELVANSDCVAATVPAALLRRLESDHPSVRDYIEWNAQREINALQDQLVAVTTGTVEERLLFLLHDLHRRLCKIERADTDRMNLPLRQYDVADAIGASTVQVSKVISRLRNAGTLGVRHGASSMQVTLPREAAE